MTSVFVSAADQAGLLAASSVPKPTGATSSPALLLEVGQAAHDRLTPDQREAAIKLAGDLIVRHMHLAEEDGANYMLHRGNADRARLSMEALIKGRDADWKRQERDTD